jgi:hypothetical protein
VTANTFEVGVLHELRVDDDTYLVAGLLYDEGVALFDQGQEPSKVHLIKSQNGALNVPPKVYLPTQFGFARLVGRGLKSGYCQQVVDRVLPDYHGDKRRYARIKFNNPTEPRLEEVCVLVLDDVHKTATVVTL